jgi:hypothetical protein
MCIKIKEKLKLLITECVLKGYVTMHIYEKLYNFVPNVRLSKIKVIILDPTEI